MLCRHKGSSSRLWERSDGDEGMQPVPHAQTGEPVHPSALLPAALLLGSEAKPNP